MEEIDDDDYDMPALTPVNTDYRHWMTNHSEIITIELRGATATGMTDIVEELRRILNDNNVQSVR